MIRKSSGARPLIALAASLMTLTAFSATLTMMTAGAQAGVQAGERVA
jgi:hypothetical protein